MERSFKLELRVGMLASPDSKVLDGAPVLMVKVIEVVVWVVEILGSSAAYCCVVVWWTRELVTPA